MFPKTMGGDGCGYGFPRVSGDVSYDGSRWSFFAQFSPRERGCFCRDILMRFSVLVFPA